MQTERRWELARDLFLELADLPEDRREAELARIALRDADLASYVRTLLRHDRALPDTAPGTAPNAPADTAPDLAPHTAPDTAPRPAPRAAPRRLGPYEIVRRIGRGGMGEVFVARRADGEYEREVAIKLLRAGTANEELVRRFLRERQTLARLDSEYIARLLDGGTTEAGEPYLVMEYVEGEPADAFAARLDLRERLELFLRIGRGVSHAHERGFVHRDLKPSNILVRGDGTPRLLDFGIARPHAAAQPELASEDPLTRTGDRLFTPEYASPEQVRGEVATVQSDIFALGALLYVFLSGANPWQGCRNQHELERSICDDDPVAPSRLLTGTGRRRLAGDLDAIVLQCLAKRPSRRYASVADLCADVERHLAGLPILARRTGVLERAARFARRRPVYPVAAALLLVAALALSVAAASERRARQRRAELRTAVADRIQAAGVRWAGGEVDGAMAELDAALGALRELPGEPALAAEVLAQKAVFTSMQQQWDASLALFDRAWPLLEEIQAPDPQVVAKLLNTRAQALHRTDPGPRSREAARRALEHARTHLPRGDTLHIDALLDWADELRRAGSADEALAVLEEVVDQGRQRDPKSEALSRYLNELAVALAARERYDDAVARYREALEILSWHRGERHPAFAKVRLNLGTTLFRLGRLDEAKAEHERSLAACLEHGLEPLTAANQHFLGRIHCAQGNLAAAETAAHQAIALRERHGLDLHADRSRCLLGIVQARSGRAEAARATLAPLLADPQPDAFLPDMEADARHLLGAILDDAGATDAARPHLARALELKSELFGAQHEACQELRRRLGRAR